MIEKLVRDFVPGFVACDEEGPQATFRIAPENEREALLFEKLLEESREFAESGGSIEELADVMEVIGTFMHLKGWKNDDVSAARDAKKKQAGGFTRFFVMRPVV